MKSNEKYRDTAYNASGISTIDKPYVFFFDLKEIQQSLKICVKSCPDKDINEVDDLVKYYEEKDTSYCRYDFDYNKLKSGVRKDNEMIFHFTGPCPKLPIYQGKPVFHRCIPTGDKAPHKELKQFIDLVGSWGFVEQTATDLYKSWHVIALVCGISLVLSIILIGLLHYLTQIISWLICIFVGVASIAITVLLWWTYYDIKQQKTNEISEYFSQETAVYVFAIIATIAMIVLLVIIYFMSSRFAGLAALFEEAGKCIYSIPQIFGPPILAFIALAIFLAFWTSVIVCLSTATIPGIRPIVNVAQVQGNVDKTPDKPINGAEAQKTFKLVEYQETDWAKYMLWIYLVALIWVSEFIFAASQLALAGAVALWYFRKPTDSPVCDSLSKLVKYHLGSVAKGSFLITIFKIPRLILTYLYAKLKTASGKGNDLAECMLKCCICCFWCLEKFIRYLNHNAYTVIAIESINFCPAAGVAWSAIWTHVISVATINGIGDFVLFLGKLAVAGICGFISLIMLKRDPEIQYYIVPVFVIAVFAFFVAHCILSLYEIVVDTLFLCVYEDRHVS